MKQILIELDEVTARELESVAPAKSRRRTEFVRTAIRRALWEVRERAVEAAYRTKPDDEPAFFDPSAWEVREAGARRQPRRKRAPK